MAKTTVRMTRLEALVRGSGLAQFQIAGITNIHPTTLGKLIKGTEAFKTKQIIALANFFEIDPEEVVGYVDVEVDI